MIWIYFVSFIDCLVFVTRNRSVCLIQTGTVRYTLLCTSSGCILQLCKVSSVIFIHQGEERSCA